MRDLSEQGLVKAAPELWRKMHEQPQGWAVTRDGADSKVIYAALQELEDNATADDVRLVTANQLVIGRRQCKECGVHTFSMVELGGVPVCVCCVHTALGVLIGVVHV